jgi:hypothetical protein
LDDLNQNGNEHQDQDQISKSVQITDLTGLIGVGGALIAELDDGGDGGDFNGPDEGAGWKGTNFFKVALRGGIME